VPFTLAHPVAAIPLLKPLRGLGVLSALVIGSLMPDVPLFLPVSIRRNVSHSLAGMFWFCLPLGLMTYLLYDRVLERPLSALMPDGMRRRLAFVQRKPRPSAWSPAILMSILLGAMTHGAWDSFTHGGAAVARFLPAIENRLFIVSGYTVYVFTVLQHASSVLGTLTLMLWIWRWYRKAPELEARLTPAPSAHARRRIVGAIGVPVIAAVAVASVSRLPVALTLRGLQGFTRGVVVAGLASLFVSVMVYAVAWHWHQRRTTRRAA
jgi:hypothetical protein